MFVLLKVIAIVLLVDLITGVVHWLEDSYFTPETPLIGKWLIEANIDHHRNSQAFLKKSWWESSWDLILIASFVFLLAYCFQMLTWEIVFFSFLIANVNQIHKWAHVTRYENKPRIIGFLQRCHILQTTKHHGQHHRKPNDSHYCTLTNALNPVLDKLKIWRGLEYLLGKKADRFNY